MGTVKIEQGYYQFVGESHAAVGITQDHGPQHFISVIPAVDDTPIQRFSSETIDPSASATTGISLSNQDPYLNLAAGGPPGAWPGDPGQGKAYTFAFWWYIPETPTNGTNKILYSDDSNNGNRKHYIHLYRYTTANNGYIEVFFSILNTTRTRIRFLSADSEGGVRGRFKGGWNHFAFTFTGTAITPGYSGGPGPDTGTGGGLVDNYFMYINGIKYTANHQQYNNSTHESGANKIHSFNHTTFFSKTNNNNSVGVDTSRYHKFDQMSWFNTALTEAEVQELYNSGNWYDITTHSKYGNVINFWEFEESNGSNDKVCDGAVSFIDTKAAMNLTGSQTGGGDFGTYVARDDIIGVNITSEKENADITANAWLDNNYLYISASAPFTGKMSYKIISVG